MKHFWWSLMISFSWSWITKDHEKCFILTWWFLAINHDQSWFPNSSWERNHPHVILIQKTFPTLHQNWVWVVSYAFSKSQNYRPCKCRRYHTIIWFRAHVGYGPQYQLLVKIDNQTYRAGWIRATEGPSPLSGCLVVAPADRGFQDKPPRN